MKVQNPQVTVGSLAAGVTYVVPTAPDLMFERLEPDPDHVPYPPAGYVYVSQFDTGVLYLTLEGNLVIPKAYEAVPE